MHIEKLKQTKVIGLNGIPTLISTIRYPNGEYETMVLNEHTGTDVNSYNSMDKEEHLKKHKEWVKSYGISEVKGTKGIKNVPQKYKDFARDYLDVVRLLQQDQGYNLLKDGGTCNFDCPVVYLKGYREDYLEVALREHSKVLGVSKEGKGWFTLRIPKNSSQGEHRSYQARYIAKHLQIKGYTTTVTYSVD